MWSASLGKKQSHPWSPANSSCHAPPWGDRPGLVTNTGHSPFLQGGQPNSCPGWGPGSHPHSHPRPGRVLQRPGVDTSGLGAGQDQARSAPGHISPPSVLAGRTAVLSNFRYSLSFEELWAWVSLGPHSAHHLWTGAEDSSLPCTSPPTPLAVASRPHTARCLCPPFAKKIITDLVA